MKKLALLPREEQRYSGIEDSASGRSRPVRLRVAIAENNLGLGHVWLIISCCWHPTAAFGRLQLKHAPP